MAIGYATPNMRSYGASYANNTRYIDHCYTRGVADDLTNKIATLRRLTYFNTHDSDEAHQ